MMHIISSLSILNHEPTVFANLNFDTVPSFSIICFRLYFVTLFEFACMSFPRLFTLFYTLTPLSLLIPYLARICGIFVPGILFIILRVILVLAPFSIHLLPSITRLFVKTLSHNVRHFVESCSHPPPGLVRM